MISLNYLCESAKVMTFLRESIKIFENDWEEANKKIKGR